MAAGIGPGMGHEALGEIVDQALQINAIRTVPCHLNDDRLCCLVRHLKQLDQAFDQLELNRSLTGGIHQDERFARLDVLITEMESQQKSPITAADLTITEMMSIDGTPQSLTIEIPPCRHHTGDDLIGRDP